MTHTILLLGWSRVCEGQVVWLKRLVVLQSHLLWSPKLNHVPDRSTTGVKLIRLHTVWYRNDKSGRSSSPTKKKDSNISLHEKSKIIIEDYENRPVEEFLKGSVCNSQFYLILLMTAIFDFNLRWFIDAIKSQYYVLTIAIVFLAIIFLWSFIVRCFELRSLFKHPLGFSTLVYYLYSTFPCCLYVDYNSSNI